MKIFSYIFYRVTTFYIERRKLKFSDASDYGVIAVSISQSIIIFVFFGFLSIIIRNNLFFRLSVSKILILIIVLFGYNFYRYKYSISFSKLESLWGYESTLIRRRRVRLMYISLIIGYLLLFIIGRIR
jgi:hypothetical protein